MFFKDLFIGYKNYIKGFFFLFNHQLYWTFLYPIFLFAFLYWGGTYFKSIEDQLSQDLILKTQGIVHINEMVWSVLSVALFDALYVVLTQFTLYVMVVLMSPVLSYLSEKIEGKLGESTQNYNLKMLWSDLKRSILIAVRNSVWYYIFLVIVVIILAFVPYQLPPLVDYAIPYLVGFYFYGFSFMDYVNERRRLNIQQSIHYVSVHKGLAISVGSIYAGAFMSYFYLSNHFDEVTQWTNSLFITVVLLILSWLLAAVSPILAVTSATLSMHDIKSRIN